MTEDEWKSSRDPGRMLGWLGGQMLTGQRKLRLFVCAACRQVWPRLRAPLRRMVEAAEDEAEQLRPMAGESWRRSRTEFHDALLAVRDIYPTDLEGEVQALASWAYQGVGKPLSCAGSVRSLCPPATLAGQADLVRELFGNPFRKVRRVGRRLHARVHAWPEAAQPDDLLFVRDWLDWDSGLVLRLAEAIDEERAYDRMPYLADALEEAGCEDADMLDHLREGGDHTRGCWVIDVILGRE